MRYTKTLFSRVCARRACRKNDRHAGWPRSPPMLSRAQLASPMPSPASPSALPPNSPRPAGSAATTAFRSGPLFAGEYGGLFGCARALMFPSRGISAYQINCRDKLISKAGRYEEARRKGGRLRTQVPENHLVVEVSIGLLILPLVCHLDRGHLPLGMDRAVGACGEDPPMPPCVPGQDRGPLHAPRPAPKPASDHRRATVEPVSRRRAGWS